MAGLATLAKLIYGILLFPGGKPSAIVLVNLGAKVLAQVNAAR